MMTKCPACAREISALAASCPGCGHPMGTACPPRPGNSHNPDNAFLTRNRGFGDLLIGAILLLPLLMALGRCAK
jgi:rRNA maturation protein Nop10